NHACTDYTERGGRNSIGWAERRRTPSGPRAARRKGVNLIIPVKPAPSRAGIDAEQVVLAGHQADGAAGAAGLARLDGVAAVLSGLGDERLHIGTKLRPDALLDGDEVAQHGAVVTRGEHSLHVRQAQPVGGLIALAQAGVVEVLDHRLDQAALGFVQRRAHDAGPARGEPRRQRRALAPRLAAATPARAGRHAAPQLIEDAPALVHRRAAEDGDGLHVAPVLCKLVSVPAAQSLPRTDRVVGGLVLPALVQNALKQLIGLLQEDGAHRAARPGESFDKVEVAL